MKSGHVGKNMKNLFVNLYFYSNNGFDMLSIICNANINAFYKIFMNLMQ